MKHETPRSQHYLFFTIVLLVSFQTAVPLICFAFSPHYPSLFCHDRSSHPFSFSIIMLNQCSFPNTFFVHIFPQPQLKQTHTAGSASTAMCILFPTKAALRAEMLDRSSSPLFDNPLCRSFMYTLFSPSSSAPC